MSAIKHIPDATGSTLCGSGDHAAHRMNRIYELTCITCLRRGYAMYMHRSADVMNKNAQLESYCDYLLDRMRMIASSPDMTDVRSILAQLKTFREFTADN
jgi:hypothetical protein